MTAPHPFVRATDRDELRRRVASSDDLPGGVEALAAEVVRLMRVDTRRALEMAERARDVAEVADDPDLRARAAWSMGHALSGVLRMREASEAYESAADRYRAAGNSLKAARVSIGWINTLMYLGEYARAIEIGESARRTLRRHGELAACARLDMNLGNLHFRVERPGEALARYDRALRAARELDDPSMIGPIQFNRANALTNVGKLDRAERLYREVGDEARRSGETRTAGFVDYSLGYLLLLRGEYGRAYEAFDAARVVFEELNDVHYLTLTHADLAELFVEMNAFRRAKEAARRARTLAERHDIRFEAARSALLQAIASLGLGELEQAARFLDDAATTFRREGNEASGSLGAVYQADLDARRGEFESAVDRLRRAGEVFAREKMPLREATTTLRLAAAEMDRGRESEADAALAAARRALRRVRSPWLLARADHLSGRLALEAGDPARAVRHLRRAVDRIEGIRGRIGIDEFRVSFSEDKAPVYADLVHALLERGGKRAVADAFRIVERSRSRALVDLLAGRLDEARTGTDAQTAALLGRLERLRGEVSWLSGFDPSGDGGQGRRNESRLARFAPRVRAREAEIADLVQRLQARDSALGALACGETSSLEEVRAGLEPDCTLVEYYVSAHGTLAFVLDRRDARVVRLPVTREELSGWLARVRFQLEKWGYGDAYVRDRGPALRASLDHVLATLRQKLWDPLEVRDERVLVVPHGPLHSLPFAALATDDGGHLVERHVFSFLPSASARRYLETNGRGASPRDARVLAVGVGDETIPHVDGEVARVRARFRRGRVLRGPRATRDRFRREAAEADVIHVATHGVFREDDPHFSALRLADGWMSLYDFYGLDLHADLVCVSACQSGRNWAGGGDEMVGLARGFLHAGASTLIVSLWPVQDESTARLMERLYGELRAGRPAEEALRTAMLHVREDRPHPYHWAPFVLIGRGGALGGGGSRDGDSVRPGRPASIRSNVAGSVKGQPPPKARRKSPSSP